MKPQSNIAWLLMLPAALVMIFVAIAPMVTVFNYSFYDIFTLDDVFWVGTEWYETIVSSPRFWASLGCSAAFSSLVLMIQLPLDIGIALMLVTSFLKMPPKDLYPDHRINGQFLQVHHL